jgi:RNA-binding protein
MSPIVRVGRGGVSDPVIEETKKSLSSHELIKVRVDADDSAARKELAAKLAAATDSQIAGMIGKTLILYRERDEDPEIELP